MVSSVLRDIEDAPVRARGRDSIFPPSLPAAHHHEFKSEDRLSVVLLFMYRLDSNYEFTQHANSHFTVQTNEGADSFHG
jgi:hypothetical protein